MSFGPRRASVLGFALCLGLATATAPAHSQQRGAADRDLQAISSYPLTLPKYKAYLAASLGIANAAQSAPQALAPLEDSGELPLDEQVKRWESIPLVRKAIAGAGLTTRDFVLTQYAILQTGMAYGIMKQYKLSADSVVKTGGVSRANLDFYQKNEAELTRLNQEFQAKMPKEPKEESDYGTEEAGDEETGDEE